MSPRAEKLFHILSIADMPFPIGIPVKLVLGRAPPSNTELDNKFGEHGKK